MKKMETPKDIHALIVKFLYQGLSEEEAGILENWIMKETGNWGRFVRESNEINKKRNEARMKSISKN